MTTRELKFFSDPSHGWLRATIADLVLFNIVNEITHYSYSHGLYVYLEEDCDIATYLAAAKQHGVTVHIQERPELAFDSVIRTYDKYDPKKILVNAA